MGARNLIWGLVVLLLGLQLRTVESYVLTPKASQFVEEKLSSDRLLSSDDAFSSSYRPKSYDSYSTSLSSITPKRVTPPRWLGWAMISLGAILVLHGLTNKTG